MLFTSQQPIRDQMRNAWWVLQIFVIFDTSQGISSAVIRGSGQQRLGSFITSTAYWIFGIPIAYLCVFVWNQGIRGLWIGPTVAVFYNTVCYSVLIQRVNWAELIRKSKERRAKDKASI